MPLALRARRLGYRLAYRALQVVWFVARPRTLGVKCLITHGDRILLVRHSYGPRVWDLPGGKMRRGERPMATAAREMNEELGIEHAAWIDVGEIRGRESFRRDTIYCFTTELAGPDVSPDPVELDTVGWFTRDALPPDLARYVAPVLAGTA